MQEQGQIAAGQEEGAPEMLLEERAQDEAQKERRRLEAEAGEQLAEHAEGQDRRDVERLGSDARHAQLTNSSMTGKISR